MGMDVSSGSRTRGQFRSWPAPSSRPTAMRPAVSPALVSESSFWAPRVRKKSSRTEPPTVSMCAISMLHPASERTRLRS